MKILIVVQARTGSTRLPGKVLLPMLGRPVLAHQLERIAAARTPHTLVVGTTNLAADEPIRRLAARVGVPSFSGHPTDLLDRHHAAARLFRADLVVKIPSDCPLVDPAAIDLVLGTFLASPGLWDYASNLHPPSWPDGNDVEVLSFEALDRAHREARRPHEREHTTPFIWDQPGRFRLANVGCPTGQDRSMSHRFTLDYFEDYLFVREVIAALWSPARPVFPLEEILALLERRPTLRALNARHAGVNWYRHHLAELRTVRTKDARVEDTRVEDTRAEDTRAEDTRAEDARVEHTRTEAPRQLGVHA